MTQKKSPSALAERVQNTENSLDKINLLKGMITQQTMQEYESLKEEADPKKAIRLVRMSLKQDQDLSRSDIASQVEAVTESPEEKAWLLEKLGVSEEVNFSPEEPTQNANPKRKLSLETPQTSAEVDLIRKKLASISDWANTEANVDFVKEYKTYLESVECTFTNGKLSSEAPLNFEIWVDNVYEGPEGFFGLFQHPNIRRFVYSVSKSWAYITGTLGAVVGMEKHEHEVPKNVALEEFKDSPEFKRLKPKAAQTPQEQTFAEAHPDYADHADRFDLSDKGTMKAVKDIPRNKKQAFQSLLRLDDAFWDGYKLSAKELTYVLRRIGGRVIDNTTDVIFNEKRDYEGKYINGHGKMVETRGTYEGSRTGYKNGGPISVFEVEGSDWIDNLEFENVEGFVTWLHKN